jgi:hypothetical protein
MAVLWAKIQFWKPKKKIPEYRFQEAPMSDGTWVEITTGEYANVVYSYGKVSFSDELGVPKLQFGYSILHSGHYDLDGLQTDQNFVTIMGDILTDIIIKNEPTRKIDTEESDLQ